MESYDHPVSLLNKELVLLKRLSAVHNYVNVPQVIGSFPPFFFTET